MNTAQLEKTAKAMVADGKGILAMDESTGTCTKRFKALGVESTEENRRLYRQTLITTPNLGEHISGAILFDETIRQSTDDGVPFTKVLQDHGVLPGIKVDTGAKDLAGFPGEKFTQGLDGLRERLKEYYDMGARFAKWRAVITITKDIPTEAGTHVNAHGLAMYAALCQEAGIVPIVEPEVLRDGNHDVQKCYDVTAMTLKAVFAELKKHRVHLPGIVLKPNIITWGEKGTEVDVDTVVDMTVKCLKECVPSEVPGIAFLSGGISDELSTEYLKQMNTKNKDLPWSLTFSYGRALQRKVLETWAADFKAVAEAQKWMQQRAEENGKASQGQ